MFKVVAFIDAFCPQYTCLTLEGHGQTVVLPLPKPTQNGCFSSVEAIEKLTYVDVLLLRDSLLAPVSLDRRAGGHRPVASSLRCQRMPGPETLPLAPGFEQQPNWVLQSASADHPISADPFGPMDPMAQQAAELLKSGYRAGQEAGLAAAEAEWRFAHHCHPRNLWLATGTEQGCSQPAGTAHSQALATVATPAASLGCADPR